MDERARTRQSKFLSLVLRHRPEVIGLKLDPQGWISIEELLAGCRSHGRELTRAMLEEIVATSPKRRFAISEDGLRVRASQGHSVEVELGYEPATPPGVLYHGTIAANLPSIRAKGLLRMRRHHVHLSADQRTAESVGRRRGKPVVLRVRADQMVRDRHTFYLSANGVWLTEQVPPQYLLFEEDQT